MADLGKVVRVIRPKPVERPVQRPVEKPIRVDNWPVRKKEEVKIPQKVG